MVLLLHSEHHDTEVVFDEGPLYVAEKGHAPPEGYGLSCSHRAGVPRLR